MPSATLQKLASSLSSGGGGAADSSPSSLNRGGVIRGILQSLKAHTGFSGGADSGSPRASRSGHADGSRANTPHYSQGQCGHILNADGLHSDLGDSENEEVRSCFSSGASGIAPAIPPRMAIFGDNSLGQAQKLRSHSERRLGNASTELACSQRDNSSPCLASRLAEALKSEAAGSSAGFKASIASRLTFAGFRTSLEQAVPETSSPDMSASWLQNLSNSQANPVPSLGGTGSLPASRPASGSKPHLELVSPSIESNASHSTTDSSQAVAEHKRFPTPAQVRPPMGLRSGKSSHQQRLLEAAAGEPLSGQPQPPQPRTAPVQTFAQASAPEALAAAASPAPRRTGAFSIAKSAAAAIAKGEVVVVPSSGSTSAGGSRSPDPGVEDVGTDFSGSGGAAAAAAAAAADPAGVAADGVPAPLRFAADLTAQRHCRSASTNELSAATVSQAVQRLQLRQQQERAAGRIHRTSTLHHPYGNNHNQQAAATTQGVLLAASNGSGGCADVQLTPQQPYSPATQLSPAHRLGLHQARASSATASFPSQNTQHYQHALYDSHRGAAAAASIGAGAGGGAQRSRVTLNSGLDEWLGDVPDMSSGRVVVGPNGGTATAAAAAAQGNTEQCSSISYMEGCMSAAGRLQAMVSSAASGDAAASYLQQLLIPDIPSTASVELQYSNTHNRIPSALALGYGSSSGPPAGPNGSGLWGGLLGTAGGGSTLLHCGGSPKGQQSNCEPMLGLCSTESNVRCASGQGAALTPDWYQMVAGGGSSTVSRAGSGFMTSTPPAAGLSGVFCGTFARNASSNGALLSNGSGSAGMAANGGADHAGKSAKQLVVELRDLYAADSGAAAAVIVSPSTGGRGGGGGGSLPSSRPESLRSLASNEELREALNDGAAPSSPCGNGATVGAQPRPASFSVRRNMAAAPNAVQRHVYHEELVAALWRLVHSKDSDSVSYLLAIDPGEKANRPIAAMLQDMRSWVYLNMW